MSPESESESSKQTPFLSIAGALGALLIFLLILWLAYLPNRPDPVDAQRSAERAANAAEAVAAGKGKLAGFEVVDASAGIVRIPIEQAMDEVVRSHQN